MLLAACSSSGIVLTRQKEVQIASFEISKCSVFFDCVRAVAYLGVRFGNPQAVFAQDAANGSIEGNVVNGKGFAVWLNVYDRKRS